MNRNSEISNLIDTADKLFSLGEYSDAFSIYLETEKVGYATARVYNNMALCKKYLGDFSASAQIFQELIKRHSDYTPAYINLTRLLTSLDNNESAIEVCKLSLEVFQNDASLLHLAGQISTKMNKLEDAQTYFNKAFSIKPDNKTFLISALANAELLYKDELFLELLRSAKKVFGNNDIDIIFFESKFYFNRNNLKKASNLANCFFEIDEESELFLPSLKLAGDINEKHKRYSEALRTYQKMNAVFLTKHPLDYSALKHVKDCIKDLKKIKNVQKCKIDTRPAHFLVGFPRSGTTLLNSVLNIHTRVGVFEENNALEKVYNKIGKPLPTQTINFSKKERFELQDMYFRYLDNETDNSGKILIDKMPLNLSLTFFAECIFDSPKFILSIRDPRSCCFSCFTQLFEPNHYMLYMQSHDTIQKLYISMLEIFYLSTKTFQSDTLEIRYEDLILKTSDTVSSILSFLNLEEEDDFKNFYKRPFIRSDVRTPSYSQIRKPISSDFIDTWRKFPLDKALYDKLEYWIKKFGYLV